MATRVVIAVLALAVAAWLAVDLRSATAQDELAGIAFSAGVPAPADMARARELATRANALNPDVRVDASLGILELRSGDRARATATFERLTRREPRNAELWLALSRAARGYDETLAARARQKVRQLVPPPRSDRH